MKANYVDLITDIVVGKWVHLLIWIKLTEN